MAQKSKKKYRLAPKFILLLSVLGVCAAGGVLYSQNAKLEEIEALRAELQMEKDVLENEKQRVEYMIEYAGSEEYLLQYAREKLGYVLPGDIKFDIEQ